MAAAVAATEATADTVTALTAELRRRDAEYEARTGEPASMGAIAADSAWSALYSQLRAVERAAAQPIPGGCSHYISRRRRYCSNRAADGRGGQCSLHAARDNPKGSDTTTRPTTSQAAQSAPAPAVDVGGDGDGDVEQASSAAGRGGAGEGREQRKKSNFKRRMKAMSNPLAAVYQIATPPPAGGWGPVFGDPALPTLVDIGTAKGGFIKSLATAVATSREIVPAARPFVEARGAHNLLGLEIYAPLVDMANSWAQEQRAAGALHLECHFVACNINVSLESLAIPNLGIVCIQFPDPWSRARQANRRVVTPALVRTLAALLPPGVGEVYCCTDVQPLAREMYATFAAALGETCAGEGPAPPPLFELYAAEYERVGEATFPVAVAEEGEGEERGAEAAEAAEAETATAPPAPVAQVDPAHQYQWQADKARSPRGGGGGGGDGAAVRWLRANPYGAATERDFVCENKWRPVYRFLLRRTHAAVCARQEEKEEEEEDAEGGDEAVSQPDQGGFPEDGGAAEGGAPRTIEFYCGIGGMHYALQQTAPGAPVLEAFDISPLACATYAHNFPDVPVRQRNIEAFGAPHFDSLAADLWLMSPPCQPFTRSGKQNASQDPRCKSFLHLMRVIAAMEHPPRCLLMENVKGFEGSETHAAFLECLAGRGYSVRQFLLSPDQLGIPNSRLRFYLIARLREGGELPGKDGAVMTFLPTVPAYGSAEGTAGGAVGAAAAAQATPSGKLTPHSKTWRSRPLRCIGEFLEPGLLPAGNEADAARAHELLLAEKLVCRFAGVVDMVTPGCHRSSCFTKAYGKYLVGTGSFLKTSDIELAVPFDQHDSAYGGKSDKVHSDQTCPLLSLRLRYFTDREIANLHCFPESAFQFPESVTIKQRRRLLGNSLNVAVVASLLQILLAPGKGGPQ